MVKRIPKYYKETMKMKKARKILLNGFNTEEACWLLGLKMKTEEAYDLEKDQLDDLKRKKAVLFYNDDHAVVLSGGFWDCDGKLIKLQNTIPQLRKNGNRAMYWYELKA